MLIRPALPEDNEALCRLELSAPQGKTIRLVERRTDFFCRAKRFSGSILMVAVDEERGRAIGVLGGAPVKVRVGGRERIGGFLFDFRAAPDRRTGLSRILYRLWERVEAELLAAGVEFIFGLVKEDNPALSIYYRMGAEKRGTRTFWSLPVYRARRIRPEVEIRPEIEAAAAYREAAAWYENYDLWPIHSDPRVLQPQYDRHLRAEIRSGGAAMKIWDTSVDYEQIVVDGPFIYELARAPLDLLRRFVPLPRIPRRGQPLRTWHLYDLHLPEGPSVLPSLLAAANNLALAEGVDFLVLSASAGEAAVAAGGRGALASLRYHLLIKEYRPLPPISPLVYLDVRML
ncbi:MAG: hypothetical protein K6U03_02720 [Firmicutes bacterium]|nr:hypothetical protein [Bacillota bacterium]